MDEAAHIPPLKLPCSRRARQERVHWPAVVRTAHLECLRSITAARHDDDDDPESDGRRACWVACKERQHGVNTRTPLFHLFPREIGEARLIIRVFLQRALLTRKTFCSMPKHRRVCNVGPRDSKVCPGPAGDDPTGSLSADMALAR